MCNLQKVQATVVSFQEFLQSLVCVYACVCMYMRARARPVCVCMCMGVCQYITFCTHNALKRCTSRRIVTYDLSTIFFFFFFSLTVFFFYHLCSIILIIIHHLCNWLSSLISSAILSYTPWYFVCLKFDTHGRNVNVQSNFKHHAK